MGAVFRREMKAYFTSPIAYIFIAVFYFYSAIFFIQYNIYWSSTDLSGVFGAVFTIMMVMLPILTMRLFAEERRQKTDQCLLTAPVSLFSIVAAKFFAAVCVFLCATSVFAFFLFSFTAMGAPIAWALVIGNLTGLLLLGGCFISVGLFVSSLTENQVAAAIIGIIACILLYFLDAFAYSLDSIISTVNLQWLGKILTAVGIYTRYSEFTTGILNFESILFFLSFIFIFNFLTVRALEKRRWA